MIDERKLIEELSKNSIFKKVTVGEETVYDVIDRLPKIGEWIPCSERLPKEKDGKVLICEENGKVMTGKYSEYSDTWYKGDMCGVGDSKVIAWMPLPKPYKGENEDVD